MICMGIVGVLFFLVLRFSACDLRRWGLGERGWAVGWEWGMDLGVLWMWARGMIEGRAGNKNVGT